MNRRRYWLWIAVFVGAALLLGTLATGWNFFLVRDYQLMHELAVSLSQPKNAVPVRTLVVNLVLGTAGFFLVLGTFIVVFLRLIREMKQNQMQSEFLATVTHELKTPIAAIELSSSLLKTENLSAEEKEKLWNSHQAEVVRLKNDVESLLQAARWESMPVRVDRQPIDLETWIQESLDRWLSILGPGAQLKRSGQPIHILSQLDLRKLNLITDNILQNARKYAKTTPTVEIHTDVEKGRWQIQFRDEGWGFDPKDSKRILKPFYRSKAYATHAIPGTGLGLYIAASASRAMGMKIKGFSQGKGLGAVFTLVGRRKAT